MAKNGFAPEGRQTKLFALLAGHRARCNFHGSGQACDSEFKLFAVFDGCHCPKLAISRRDRECAVRVQNTGAGVYHGKHRTTNVRLAGSTHFPIACEGDGARSGKRTKVVYRDGVEELKLMNPSIASPYAADSF